MIYKRFKGHEFEGRKVKLRTDGGVLMSSSEHYDAWQRGTFSIFLTEKMWEAGESMFVCNKCNLIEHLRYYKNVQGTDWCEFSEMKSVFSGSKDVLLLFSAEDLPTCHDVKMKMLLC